MRISRCRARFALVVEPIVVLNPSLRRSTRTSRCRQQVLYHPDTHDHDLIAAIVSTNRYLVCVVSRSCEHDLALPMPSTAFLGNLARSISESASRFHLLSY